MTTNKAIYPGTFDPLTIGHLDIVTRAAQIFDEVILAIADNPSKLPLFDLNKRVELAIKVTVNLANVTVLGFIGLIANFAQQQEANIIIRGLRSVSDFESEMQMMNINRNFMPGIESVFMMPTQTLSYISSTLVKEVALNGGSVDKLIPALIAKEIKARIKNI
ncbi:pantetheine-phosphate adenylyltransferase [Candidatus Palibaumannia cicadellinicola]|uniref:Phosphopantetheine adenylyltransferase n=1 Tax=Candidatus Palibaumannia cicadellinicola TaxID=186490 RepID=A0A0K2BKB6_9GAMM|nr:pantetheine-phosphate adenylyltransferase [Candidatus Baumannia cicadellinicola]AKZ65765.1 Phosphopantetheine adenylyltransferase [Candidatus Baumannia cicadellinicola]